MSAMTTQNKTGAPRALFVDLNNSDVFPALAIGYLTSVLRQANYEVEVLSPLSQGVSGLKRDLADTWKDHLTRRLYFSTHPIVVRFHDEMRRIYKRQVGSPHPRLLGELDRILTERKPDLILISAYLDHRPSVEAIGARAVALGIPVLLGGPVFNHPKIAEAWRDIPGVTAIYGGEAEASLPAICADLVAGREPSADGVVRTDRPLVAPRLETLDNLPIPDFSDFPWGLYKSRVLTVMTGRGCEWGRCAFCSDVITANGRGFRTRPLDRVLEELAVQSRAYDTRNTFFLDIKLNSDLQMWRGLIDNYQRVLPGGKWVGVVHVAARGENGLDRDTLHAAKAAGLTRVSFGLESGSELLNRRMGKGTSIPRTVAFLEDAKDAGLSVRTTMMLGFPGETEDDVWRTAAFLDEYGHLLDRVRISRFKAIPGTRFERLHTRFPDRYQDLEDFQWRYGEGRADYRYRPALASGYRKAKARVLRQVFDINRKPLEDDAAMFNGLM